MSAEIIVKQSFDKLTKTISHLVLEDKKKLGDPNERKEQLENNAIQLIDHILSEAFISMEEEAKAQSSNLSIEEAQKVLFRKFSLLLHPDKIKANFSLVKDLDYIGMKDNIPMQILNVRKEKANMLTQIASNPVKGVQNWLIKLFKASPYFLFADNRYPQPLKFLAKTIDWLINISLIIATTGTLTGLGIIAGIISFASWMKHGVINLLTGHQYTKEVENYKNDPLVFIKAKKAYLDVVRDTLLGVALAQEMIPEMNNVQMEDLNTETIPALSDEKIMEMVFSDKVLALNIPTEDSSVEEKVNEAINEDIRNSITIQGSTHVKLVGKAMFHAIFAPLPKEFSQKAQSIFARMLLSLMAPVFIAAAITIETLRFLNTIAITASIAVAVTVKAASVLLVSGPIFAFDAVYTLAQALKSCFNSSMENNTVNDSAYDNCPTVSKAIKGLGNAQESTTKRTYDKKPCHERSPIHQIPKTHSNVPVVTSRFGLD